MLLHKLRNRHFFLLDALILVITPMLALMLRRDSVWIPEGFLLGLIVYILVALVIRLTIFRRFGLYSRVWRYASIDELMQIGTAVLVSTVIITLIILFIRAIYPFILARTMLIIDSLLVFLAVGGIRFSVRFVGNRSQITLPGSRRALIIGAGDAGEMIARELLKSPVHRIVPLGFLDDDSQKHNMYIHGLPVIGGRNFIPWAAEEKEADLLILAIPSSTGEVIREITTICNRIGLETKIIPSIHEILDGGISADQLRDVDIVDLLRREPVRTDLQAVKRLVEGRNVLVTGGGGSIGSELCRQLLFCGPRELIILGHGENSVFEIFHELRQLGVNGPKITPVIADTRFSQHIKILFKEYKPEIVFHAAAHKHVSLMELNPSEAITNNVEGTKNLLEAAQEVGVRRFVMISTDKAVNPTSIMGASKRVAELLVHQAALKSGNPYVTVRFGNVLGSRGSVVLTFKKQIAAGGPVTVTHPEVERYFMTIPEATQLVLQAASLGTGGEVFVLDMGKPVKILDMANDMIRLSGYEAGRDIKIDFVGLRPGDKLFEELFISGEDHEHTIHEKIFVAKNAGRFIPNGFNQGVSALEAAADRNDAQAIILGLNVLVPEFKPPVSERTAGNQDILTQGPAVTVGPASASPPI
jgi:FlaA1/EpsC-like NDP-sugar epimerase